MANNATYVRGVLKVFAEADLYDLWWQVENEVKFGVRVNDVFWWGTADVEMIEFDDIPLLWSCLADLERDNNGSWLPELFAARKRGMRPQGAVYRGWDATMRALFDACGPERETDVFNPHPAGEQAANDQA